LGGIIERLDAVPMVEPPATLHPRIVARIDALPRERTRHEERGFFAWIGGLLPTPAWRYGSTFGLGLAAGAVVLALVRPGSPVDPSHVSGTMTPPAVSGVVPVSVPAAGVSGSVAVAERGSVTQVRLLLHGEKVTEWVFDVPTGRDETPQPIVLQVNKAGETVFEGTVQPVGE
jgi:hypothetical protein